MSHRSSLSSAADSLVRAIRVGLGIAGILVVFVSAGWAQRLADLTGTVADSSGALIPGVQVDATNTATGVKSSTVTNEAGLYRFVELNTGPYRIDASKAGFKTYTTSVVLEASRTTTINVTMELGQVTQSIEVKAQAPTLETSSPAMANTVEEKLIRELPTVMRRPEQLIWIIPGVTYYGIDPTNTDTAFFSLAGGRELPMFYIDGASATNARSESDILDLNPSIEITQEFRVIANNAKAEYGGSIGGMMLMTTKSGTNDYHGTLWEYNRQKAYNARNFFARSVLPFQENIFGAAVGGPIKKNKLFFFGSYEGTRQLSVPPLGNNSGATLFQTLPTDIQRLGDFSNTYNLNGTLRTIYDPLTTCGQYGNPPCAVDGSGNAIITRQPFPNNIIPANRISPVAQKIASYLPAPNQAPQNITGFNNFSGIQRRWMKRDSPSARVDYDHSEKDKLMFRWIWETVTFDFDGPWPGIADGAHIRAATKSIPDRNPTDSLDQMLLPWSKNFVWGWTHILNPGLISDLRFDYATRSWGGHQSSAGLDYPQNVGIPLPNNIPPKTQKFNDNNNHFPIISAGQYTMPSGAWLGSGDYQLPMRNFHAVESVTYVKSSHTFKFGYETRRSTANFYSDLNSSGTYNFAARGTAASPSDAASGDPFASFLLDWPDSGTLLGVGFRSLLISWHAAYAQDDWRVTPKLTLNLGVRYEYDTPLVEQRGNYLSGFDLNGINSVCNCPGVYTYPKHLYNSEKANFMPRLGFAYSIKPNTVVRGGFGTYFEGPVHIGARGTPGRFRPDIAAAVDTATPDNGITAPYHLATGLPTLPVFTPSLLTPGFGAVPIGSRPVLGAEFADTNLVEGYSEQFNVNVQHQLSNGLFFEVGWVGNVAHKLQGNMQLNQIPIQRATTASGQKDRPVPQYNSILRYDAPIFNSNYQGLMFKVEKRYSNGLSVLSNFTWSKMLDDLSQSDLYNRRANKGVSTGNRGKRFIFSWNYELPLGKGRKFLDSGPLSYVIGGWNVGGINTVQSGIPLTPTASPNLCFCFPSGSVRADRIGNPEGAKQLRNWFNLAAFQHPGSLRFGNSAPGVIIGPGLWTLDLSVSKDVVISKEANRRFNFRADIFNSLNHANFDPPSTAIFPANAPGTTNVITSAQDPRLIQLSLRFIF